MKNHFVLLQPNNFSMKTPADLGKNENISMRDSFVLLQTNKLSVRN